MPRRRLGGSNSTQALSPAAGPPQFAVDQGPVSPSTRKLPDNGAMRAPWCARCRRMDFDARSVNAGSATPAAGQSLYDLHLPFRRVGRVWGDPWQGSSVSCRADLRPLSGDLRGIGVDSGIADWFGRGGSNEADLEGRRRGCRRPRPSGFSWGAADAQIMAVGWCGEPRSHRAGRVGRAGDRRSARRVGAHLDPRAGSAAEADPPVCDQRAGEVQEHAGVPIQVPAAGAGPPVGIPDCDEIAADRQRRELGTCSAGHRGDRPLRC